MADVSVVFRAVGDQVVIGALRRIGEGLIDLAAGAIREAAGAFVDFARSGVDAASSLGESLNKVSVVFGDSADAVMEFARAAATSLGQSQQQALEAAGTYGNLLTSIGVLPDAAAEMSMSLVTLASDLASLNNASPEETLLALRSALTGEFEPIKRFGAALSADAVAAKALAMGLAAAKDEITPAIRAQAAYALILEQTTNAQGDFARTSDGLANQQRILTAQWTDLQAQVGTALLPTMTALTGTMTSQLMPALAQLATDALPQITPVLSEIGVAAVQWISGALIPALIGAVEWVRANWPQIQATLTATWAQVQPVLQALADFVTTQVLPAIVAMVQWVVENWPQIQATIAQAMQQVQSIIDAVTTTIQALWAEWGDEIMAVIEWVTERIRIIWDAFGAAFRGDWYAFGAALREGFDHTWRTILDIVARAIEWFRSQDWGQVGRDILSGIAHGVQAAAHTLTQAAIGAARAALDAVRGFLGIRSPSTVFADVGRQLMTGMALGIERGMAQPMDAAQQAGAAVTRAVYLGGVSISVAGAGDPSAVARAVRAEIEHIARSTDARIRLR